MYSYKNILLKYPATEHDPKMVPKSNNREQRGTNPGLESVVYANKQSVL